MINIRPRRLNLRLILLLTVVLVIGAVGYYIKSDKNVNAINFQRSPIDVVLVIDDSGSMDGTKISSAKTAATDFINGNTAKNITGLQPGDRVAVVTLNNGSMSGLTSTFSVATNFISNIDASGGTSYKPALVLANNILSEKNPSSTAVIIFLADGDPGDGQSAVDYCSNILKPAGVQIYTIGLGVAPGSNAETLLKAMASSVNGTANYSSGGAGDLVAIYNNISASLIRLLSLADKSGSYISDSNMDLIGAGGGDIKLAKIILPESTENISKVIKSSGTVTIKNNIINDSSKKYNDVSQIPQMVIIAKKIVIAANVTQVDAWLIARDSGNGSIQTCDVDPSTKETIDVCNNPLIVNGPVMTDHLYMLRTFGSGVGSDSGTPAEIFNLRADAYLWAAAHALVNGRVQTTYTTELPPRF
jgi:uncharacterized protein YegL